MSKDTADEFGEIREAWVELKQVFAEIDAYQDNQENKL